MVDRIIPIRLYPNKMDSGVEPEEIIFTTVVNPTKSEKSKTNLRELKIQKIELLTDNAEAYCALLNKLRTEKWDREAEEKSSFWTRSKDFADWGAPRRRSVRSSPRARWTASTRLAPVPLGLTTKADFKRSFTRVFLLIYYSGYCWHICTGFGGFTWYSMGTSPREIESSKR